VKEQVQPLQGWTRTGDSGSWGHVAPQTGAVPRMKPWLHERLFGAPAPISARTHRRAPRLRLEPVRGRAAVLHQTLLTYVQV